MKESLEYLRLLICADKETKHKTRIEDDPIVSAYLHYVDNSWKPCNLSFINIAAPNYIDVATGRIIPSFTRLHANLNISYIS